ncbi:MAG: hypothetical protein NTV34_08110 [Proteobacteria bacterium]|nr:hypothetical protein [Pseudomonadota bacterium]
MPTPDIVVSVNIQTSAGGMTHDFQGPLSKILNNLTRLATLRIFRIQCREHNFD